MIETMAKMYGLSEKEFLYRADGRIEWICKHGIGHTVFYPRGSNDVHGCDGCCKQLKKKKVTITSVEKIDNKWVKKHL